jgi:arabinofuranosyltransferase
LIRFRYILVVCVVATFTFISRNLRVDDALIYDRYISNALHGLGLVYNAGERVNALTSPLYAYLLLGVSWLVHGEVQLAAALIFCATFAGACVLAERIVPWSGFLLGSMAYFYGLLGMETPLLLFLIMVVVTVYVESRLSLLPTFLLLLILTRAEAGALALVLGWSLWRQRKLPKPASFLPAIGMGLLYLGINFALYGRPLSDSGKAKLGQGVSGYWGAWPTAFLHVWHLWPYFKFTPYILIGIILCCWFGMKKAGDAPWSKAVIPFLAVLFLFYWLLNLPAYTWYYAPFVFFLSLYAMQGLPESKAASMLLVAVLIAQALTNAYWLRGLSNGDRDYTKIGNWLELNTAPGATVAACEIGEVGWISHRYVFDILGLTNPKNAAHVSRRDAVSWLAEDKPDYVVVHKPAWVWEQVAIESSQYQEAPFHANSVYILRRKGD